MATTLTGTCHCGAVRWQLDTRPERATICNCSVCRRYGVIWAYGWDGHDVHVTQTPGARSAYIHGDRSLAFHRCATCGVVTDWTALAPRETPQGPKLRCAVNLRLLDPAAMAAIGDVPLRLFDGAGAFEERPADGRTIADLLV